ncbi:MAG: metal ABC transporter permease [Candidatus Berkiellales bacterium]
MIDSALFDLRYLLWPFIGGIGVALVAGPLGALMVWRRLAYFGDTLSHSGLLGVTLALALHINVTVGVCFIAILVALFLLNLQQRMVLASDTLLGLLSHTMLALGLLTLALVKEIQVDVLGFLYGDILAISQKDVLIVYLGGAVVLVCLALLWQSLLRITVHSELAQVEGVNVRQVQAGYLLLLAIVVAIALKIVGVLLITALLIIPAAAARFWAKSPEQMAGLASVIGMISVFIGMLASHVWDIPTGPAIVVVSACIFTLSFLSKI